MFSCVFHRKSMIYKKNIKKTRKFGKLGKFGKFGKIGKLRKFGKLGKFGKIGNIWKIWKIWKIVHLPAKQNENKCPHVIVKGRRKRLMNARDEQYKFSCASSLTAGTLVWHPGMRHCNNRNSHSVRM